METLVQILLITVITWLAGLVILVFGVILLPRDFGAAPHPPPLWLRIPGNLIGWPLIVAGIVFLPTPANGIIMILTGIVIADFPRKHRVLLWLLQRKGLLESINSIRARFRRPLIPPPQVNGTKSGGRNES